MNTDKQTLSDNYATGRVALSYALSDRTTVYSVYARWYKSGGWFDYVGTNVSRGLAEPTYKAAKTDSVELGFKFADAQGRLRVSGAAFFSETADDHLVGFDAVNFVATTENFDTQSVGAELQITWSPMREFLLSGGLAYTDATITRIPDASSTDAQDGDAVPASPLWSTTLSMTHEQTLPSFWGITNPALLSTVTHRYVGERTADVGEHFDLPAYHKLDARIGISTHSTDVYLWGDNLLDEIYDVGSGFYVPAIPADFGGTGQDAKMSTPARGRALGIGVKHHF